MSAVERIALQRACFLCGSRRGRTVWSEDGHRYVCCSSCTAVFSDITAETYAASQHNVWDDDDLTDSTEQFYVDARGAVHTELLRRLTTLVRPGASLLDVGCGLGAFVARARAAGFEAYGCEPAPAWALRAKQRVGAGRIANAYASPELFGGRRFSVITLWDVIEHLHDPLALLHTLAAMLEPGGVLFIRTPNIAFVLPVYGARRRLGADVKLGPLNHVVYFSSRTMRAALGQAGLTASAWPVLVPPQVPVTGPVRSDAAAVSVRIKNGWSATADRLARISDGRIALGSDLDVLATRAPEPRGAI